MLELKAREVKINPEEILRCEFESILQQDCIADAMFLDSSYKRVIGIANLSNKLPVLLDILNNKEIVLYINQLEKLEGSILFLLDLYQNDLILFVRTENNIVETHIPYTIKSKILGSVSCVQDRAGSINDKGEHVIDLNAPSPGPHFYVNLLLGNRVGYSHGLQTTPKSVVDRLGRGSFRAHSATQVLATRWDMLQEENGFPANRQFYIIEDGSQIFYSANPSHKNILSAKCIHSQNFTRIIYMTHCGLEIERLIFLLPQEKNIPLAVEAQQIKIRNLAQSSRNLKVVYTGMFGSANPHALMEDVLYSNIIMQSRIITNEEGKIIAVAPDYYPEYTKGDYRFHSTVIHNKGIVEYPTEFCTNYNEFIGNGSLEKPQGVLKLSNKLSRKGPGFFAIGMKIDLEKDETCILDNFTGLVSNKVNSKFDEYTFRNEIQNLLHLYGKEGKVLEVLENQKKFYNAYKTYLQINTGDKDFDIYVNNNLPFQVLYQTFVSRSFAQTQKGYREIGFREIQDIFTSMYYFISMGEKDFVKDLIKEWCNKVFEFGYAYHNFFWVGKEPGKWSDDGLWLIQAVYRYINLTGDIDFLDEECKIAGTSPIKTRSIYDTIKSILRYSGEISIGKHKIPLLDFADWNDCLKLDTDYIDGITKEKLYKEQIAKSGDENQPFESDYSESVMNGFLLKYALDQMVQLARKKGDSVYTKKYIDMSNRLYNNLQKYAWKEDFFARVLFNRFEDHQFSYLGAKGDGLSATSQIDGTYFLNSFSWSILSNTATEEQIGIMLDVMETVLKTPYGLRLMSPTDLGKVASGTATGEYFPGDRENGGVFKHACMMATAAMFKAAKEVNSPILAEKLSSLAYWMIDLVVPYKTMEHPFETCGNPRFCTQYNNSETGENIGPILSGTSTWLTLTLMSAFGIEYTTKGIEISPILRKKQEKLSFTLNTGKAIYNINISKPSGFFRMEKENAKIMLDGKELQGNVLPNLNDGKKHSVEVWFQ